MRKGYGPTGVSFGYSFADFQKYVAANEHLHCELVIGGNCYKSIISTTMSESEQRCFYDAADHVAYHDGKKIFEVIT
jgi:hypothetical protein